MIFHYKFKESFIKYSLLCPSSSLWTYWWSIGVKIDFRKSFCWRCWRLRGNSNVWLTNQLFAYQLQLFINLNKLILNIEVFILLVISFPVHQLIKYIFILLFNFFHSLYFYLTSFIFFTIFKFSFFFFTVAFGIVDAFLFEFKPWALEMAGKGVNIDLQ